MATMRDRSPQQDASNWEIKLRGGQVNLAKGALATMPRARPASSFSFDASWRSRLDSARAHASPRSGQDVWDDSFPAPRMSRGAAQTQKEPRARHTYIQTCLALLHPQHPFYQPIRSCIRSISRILITHAYTRKHVYTAHISSALARSHLSSNVCTAHGRPHGYSRSGYGGKEHPGYRCTQSDPVE
jgi:hypothetical protein